VTLFRFSLLAAIVCAGAAHASNYLTSNGLVVEPRGDTFFVPYRGLSGARDFWCAAGEYAQNKLHQPPAAIIYRTTEPPRRSGEGIGFSLSPSQSASATGLVRFGGQGGGMTIAAAQNHCDTEMLFFR